MDNISFHPLLSHIAKSPKTKYAYNVECFVTLVPGGSSWQRSLAASRGSRPGWRSASFENRGRPPLENKYEAVEDNKGPMLWSAISTISPHFWRQNGDMAATKLAIFFKTI
jgi:hypothetical protein